ncbi:MAG: glycerol-3-phosphate dehydrogenase [Candidatus Marinimicrobia bacterium]|nr:glycerol-3-phosphate dehydrogenase [Candidatus Neomarinimicrobiota bacterium]
MSKISFIGCGSWGAALGLVAAQNGFSVTMWHRNAAVVEYMKKTRVHYLVPDLQFPDNVNLTINQEEAVNAAQIIVIAIPSQSIRGVLQNLSPLLSDDKIIVNVAKGIEIDTLMTASDIINELTEINISNTVTLSGPSHAEEVIAGYPTTLVSASRKLATAKKIQKIFSNGRLRIYSNQDIRGVELVGAMKNVIAIAAGISDGIGYGDNSKAALMTRGIREIAILGSAMGANSDTFSGLSGIGDLIVTCLSNYSRNRKVGQLIGEGKFLDDILKNMRMVAEGVETAKSLHQLIEKYKVEMPISEGIYQVLFHNADPESVVSKLMNRRLSAEK